MTATNTYTTRDMSKAVVLSLMFLLAQRAPGFLQGLLSVWETIPKTWKKARTRRSVTCLYKMKLSIHDLSQWVSH